MKMGAIQNSVNQALGVAAALAAPSKALKEQEQRALKREEEIRKTETVKAINKLNLGKALAEETSTVSQGLKDPKSLGLKEVQEGKRKLEGSVNTYQEAHKMFSEGVKEAHSLVDNPKDADALLKMYAKGVSSYGEGMTAFQNVRDAYDRREADLLKAEMANQRAQEIYQAKKQLREQSMQKRQSYLDQPLSIGGKEIGTVRGLPKDMRSQVKEGMKNGRK